MTSWHKTGAHPFYIGMYIHIYTHIYVHKYTSQKECLHIFYVKQLYKTMKQFRRHKHKVTWSNLMALKQFMKHQPLLPFTSETSTLRVPHRDVAFEVRTAQFLPSWAKMTTTTTTTTIFTTRKPKSQLTTRKPTSTNSNHQPSTKKHMLRVDCQPKFGSQCHK